MEVTFFWMFPTLLYWNAFYDFNFIENKFLSSNYFVSILGNYFCKSSTQKGVLLQLNFQLFELFINFICVIIHIISAIAHFISVIEHFISVI